MLLCSLSLLLATYDDNDLHIIILSPAPRLLREDDASTVLLTHASDVGALTANQEAMVLRFAADLQRVVLLCLQRERNG